MNKTNKMELDSILNSHINNIFSVHQHGLLLQKTKICFRASL